ncbi:hypothetical protein BaRGS_00005930 [Batillaria attramentaria]|uniref:Uncharacterized protein n=1 Tax=Batillaria attramentaria TaxID=370345 RepID=A0ABD0LTK4_9CAEN
MRYVWTALIALSQSLTVGSEARASCGHVGETPSGTVEIDLLVGKLHVLGVLTLVLDCKVSSIDNRTTLLALNSVGGHLIIGSDQFVRRVFQQVARFADETDRLNLLFETEWLTVVKEENLQETESTLRKFENVVAVVHLQQNGGIDLMTLRRQRDETHLSAVMSLPHRIQHSLARKDLLPNLSYGLGGRTLRVVVKENSYMLFSSETQGKKVYQGVLMDVLQELSIRVNFSYLLMESSDTSYGVKLDNGQWDGLIGMLTRKALYLPACPLRMYDVETTSIAKLVQSHVQHYSTVIEKTPDSPVAEEADIALATLRLTTERAAVADPTFPFSYENAWLVARKPEPSRINWRFFLHPFQAGVYMAVGACLAGVLVLLLTVEVCQYRWLGGRPGSPFVSCTALPFSSMAELVNQDTYSWGIQAGTAIDSILKTSPVEVFQKYYQGTLNFAKSDASVRDHSIQVQKEKVLEGNYAFLTGSSYSYKAWNTACTDVVVTWPVGIEDRDVLYLQKGSPFTNIISKKLDQIVNAGLVTHWKRKWTPAKPPHCNQDGGQASRTIQLAEVQTAFYLAGAGVGLAVLTLGLESLLRRDMNST